MTIKITDHGSVITVTAGELTPRTFDLRPDEQRELLESLARTHGFSIVDREERSALRGYVAEVREDGRYASSSPAGLLADTVADVLQLDTQEV